jgi:hypothetical protein
MHKFLSCIGLMSAVILLYSCEDSSIQSESNTTIDSTAASTVSIGDTLVHGQLKLYPLNDSPLFEDAILHLNTPNEGGLFKNNVVNFSYDLKNFQLTQPTSEGSCSRDCANSAQGQHIHLILNNEPYMAKYSTDFSDTLTPGHYVALSFLSRSYHESIKHYDAYDLRQFTVGEKEEKKIDLTQPFLFYSRPKGEYKGKETKKILLDFYVVNAHLAPHDFKVRVSIDGIPFLLSNWKAYIIEGLSMGKHTIKIELLDKSNRPVEGVFNTTERSILLSE